MSRKYNITLTETSGETDRAMRNTVIYDRVLLFKNKFEEHLQQDFDILPQHFRQIQDLKNIELDKIAERLDYMMTEDEYFAGDVGKCTIPAFVRNFNRFRSTEISRSLIDEKKRAEEIKKKAEAIYYRCNDCGQQVKRSMRHNHEMYICQKSLTQTKRSER